MHIDRIRLVVIEFCTFISVKGPVDLIDCVKFCAVPFTDYSSWESRSGNCYGGIDASFGRACERASFLVDCKTLGWTERVPWLQSPIGKELDGSIGSVTEVVNQVDTITVGRCRAGRADRANARCLE